MDARGNALWFAFDITDAVLALHLAAILVFLVAAISGIAGLLRGGICLGFRGRNPAWNFPQNTSERL